MKFLPNNLTSLVSKTALKVSNHSPQILLGAGVVGFGTTVVLASRATLNLPELIANAERITDGLNAYDGDEWSAEEVVKAKAVHRVKTVASIAKLYLPALVVGSLSIAALAGSHRILTTRNAALTAAYATLDKGFREYRSRVLDEVGEEKERDIRYGAITEKVSVTDEVTGRKKVVEKKVSVKGHYSDYARLFEESNVNWRPEPEYNLIWLRGIENMANDRLRAKGFVILNSVYKDLGLPETTAGSVVGWVSKENGGKDGDIDFGLFRDDLRLHDYLTTRDGAIWLDFNVDGDVHHLIDKI